MQVLIDQYEAIRGFMESGGNVLTYIALVLFLLWTLIFERLWYFRFVLKGQHRESMIQWEARVERKSWNAHKIREAMISRIQLDLNSTMPIIQSLVVICPLLGLLGTVTGMIEVFHVLAVTGGGDAKAMAGGVARATIPTMSGMVSALSGIFALNYLKHRADDESELLADHLTMDH